MKKKLFAIIIAILPLVGYSQLLELKLGTPYEVVDAFSKNYFYKNNKMLTIKNYKRDVIVQTFDKETLKQLTVKTYEDFEDNFQLEAIKEIGNRYYILFSIWDKKNETEQLFGQEVSIETGAFVGDKKLILKVPGKLGSLSETNIGGYGFFSFGGTVDKFDFHESFDKSKLMINYRVKPQIKNDSKSFDIIGFNVFDANLNKISAQEITMPYTEKKMNNVDYTVDSDGNAYLLAKVYNDNTTNDKKRGDEGSNYHMELFKVSPNSPNIQKTELSLSKKFVSALWIAETQNKDIICTGYYNDGDYQASVNGIVTFKINNKGQIANSSSYEIPKEIINQYTNPRTQKRNNKKEKNDELEFDNLVFRNLVLNNDGSIVIIGERYYVEVHTYTDSRGNTRTTYTYHYDEILATKIDATGKVAWMRKIPKRQVGKAGKGGMSFKYIGDGTNHYFIYLDNIKNMKIDYNMPPATHADGRGGFLIADKINDATGTETKTELFDITNVQDIKLYQFFTDRILSLDKNEFGIEFYKKQKEDVWVKVKLQ